MFPVFTPTQAKSAAEERMSKDALRARGLAETTKELLATKDEVEREFRDTMQRQQKEAEEWFIEYTEKKNDLRKEVGDLMRQRAEALSPLLLTEGEIHSVGEKLGIRELNVKAKEERTDEQSRALMLRMDECSLTQADLDRREKRLKVAETGAETQRLQIAESAKLLNDKLAEFQVRSNEREFDLSLRQSEQDAVDNLHKEKERQFVVREQELEAAKRILSQDKLTLEENIKEREEVFTMRETEINKTIAGLSLREIEIRAKEEYVLSLEKMAEKKVEKIEVRSKQYEAEYEAFQLRVEEMEKGFIYLRTEIEATQKLQEEKEKAFKKREQENAKERRQIADQRVLLEKGFAELTKLKK